MTRRAPSAAALALLLLGDARAIAQDPKAAPVQEIATPDGRERFRVPASWKAKALPMPDDVVSKWEITLPGGAAPVLTLTRVGARRRNELLDTAYLCRDDLEKHPESKPRFAARPIPHVVCDTTEDSVVAGSRPACKAVRVAARCGFVVKWWCPKDAFEQTLPDFFAVAGSLASSRELADDVPSAYRRVVREGFLYCLHPKVKDAEMLALHTFLAAREADFARRFGTVPKSAQNPLVVVVHPDAATATDSRMLLPGSADGVFFDPITDELFAVPPPAEGTSARRSLCRAAGTALHKKAFAYHVPTWHGFAAMGLSEFEGVARRPFPAVAESLVAELPRALPTMAELAASEALDPSHGSAAMVYVAFLTAAGPPYRDAFAEYLLLVRSGAAAKSACAETLLALDQEKLRDAAAAFLSTFTTVTGK